jgi:hypothetical protein
MNAMSVVDLGNTTPQTNILWLKLTEASSDTSWFPIHLNQFSQSVDSTDQRSVVTAPVSLWP